MTWDNTYLRLLFRFEWELAESPAGAKQWRTPPPPRIQRHTAATELRVLTDKVDRENAVRRDLKALRSQLGYPVEIRRVTSHVLHDRYLIDDVGMLLIGTSLNGIGLKQSMVVQVGDDLRPAAGQAFDALWPTATVL